MHIMKIQTIIKDNIKDINYDDVIIVFFAESGAIGELILLQVKQTNISGIKQIIHLLELLSNRKIFRYSKRRRKTSF